MNINRILKSSWVRESLWARERADNVHGLRLVAELDLPPSASLYIVGEGVQLGAWQPMCGVRLLCDGLPKWYLPASVEIDAGQEYKLVVIDGDKVVWESGENRVWSAATEPLVFRGELSYTPRVGGVAIPLFSIRSSQSEGIGDYPSLGEFAHWSASCGLSVVQILPINDTTATHTWRDSYPYNAISVYALHPIYLRISHIDPSVDTSQLRVLDKLCDVDYDSVDSLKWALFRDIYSRLGSETLQSPQYQAFYQDNRFWLDSYAAFSLLRDKYNTPHHSLWGEHSSYSAELLAQVLTQYSYEAGLYYFLQFHAHKQLSAARAQAQKVRVSLKGDIPIGVSPSSVDVWVEPANYNLLQQAGAPPDDFAEDGQNWGFPTYNWDYMAKSNYSWWNKRFAKMADYFDIYRIDHILGFFRIWEIPKPHRSGLLGHFYPALPLTCQELSERGLPMDESLYLGSSDDDLNRLFVRDHSDPACFHPRIRAQHTQVYKDVLNEENRAKYDAIYDDYFYHRHNEFWAAEAMRKLPALVDATAMLPCAEDLGMIPASVPHVMEQMGLLSLEIERMPKGYGVEFGDTQSYPYMSVAATSTHDMSTIRGWWRECSDSTQRYFNGVLGVCDDAPADASAAICRMMVARHFDAPSMAVILPLQDLLAMSDELRNDDVDSERINVPADSDNYWKWRMHLGIDALEGSVEFNNDLMALVRGSGR